MEYDRLGADERRKMIDERIKTREEEHFRASMELAEAADNPSEITFRQNVEDLQAKIDALKAQRELIE